MDARSVALPMTMLARAAGRADRGPHLFQRRMIPRDTALCLSSRDSRQHMFEALKSTKRSATRILFAYSIPCCTPLDQ